MITNFNMFKYLFHHVKLFSWITTIYIHDKYYKRDIILYKCLLNSVLSCGCVPIKFIQWLIPYLYITLDKKDHHILELFKKIYEDCIFHSFDKTEKIYYHTFKQNIHDDYTDIKEISSGSIGQVYRAINKNNHKIYALKVLHPNVKWELFMTNYILYLLSFIFSIDQIVSFKINDFFKDFKKQSDFINEANNLLYFYDKYKDNNHIEIPKLLKLSGDILIMEYMDGDKIDNKLTVHNQYKYSVLFSSFCLNNLHILKTNHGDLHEGNFKIKDSHLIIYDFGYCWSNEENKNTLLFNEFITIFSHVNSFTYKEKLNIILDMFILINTDIKYKEEIIKSFKSYEINNPEEAILFIIHFYKENNILLCINSINLLLTYIHLQQYSKNSFYLEQYNYCKTYNIFPEYQLILKNSIIKYEDKKTRVSDNEFNHLKKYIL